MISKIIVVGAVDGNFSEVFNKISTIQAKNNFSFALIVGEFFKDPVNLTSEDDASVESLLNGSIKIPLPTYFSLNKHALPTEVLERLEATSGEVCDNLIFLGKRSSFKTTEGIKIAALGGRFYSETTTSSSKDRYAPSYSISDATALHGANSIDLLITSEWPAAVTAGSGSKLTAKLDNDPMPQPCVAGLCADLRPRYHFSSSKCFFEREPFFHPPLEHDLKAEHAITRFISLAPYGNTSKQKWMYAFSLDSTAESPQIIPPGVTASPFAPVNRKRTAMSDQAYSRFAHEYDGQNRSRQKKRARQPPPGPEDCFFCLSNPNLAAHLVTSIGSDVYVTTAKGPLSDSNTFSPLSFPCHLLIIPLAHTPTLGALSDPSTKVNTVLEMQRYRTTLNVMLHKESHGKLGSICWEISRASGIHTHWQFMPLPTDLIEKGLIKAAFQVESQNEHYPTLHVSKTGADLPEHGDYFMATTWQPGDEEVTFTIPIDSSFRFDLQFGRRVLSKLLNLERRLNWRDCNQTESEEIADAEKFKEVFKKYDFTLNE